MYALAAPAKINLSLDIKSRRPDGYHEVDMVMQSISLADTVYFEAHPELLITCSNPLLPVDQRNIARRAVEVIRNFTGFKGGIKIHIQKHIPIAAGLAGGSTDAAAVLLGLNHFWNLGLTVDQLLELGLKLGADVPFCILKGVARAEGIGERLTPIQSKLRKPVYILTPNQELSTATVYKGYNPNDVKHRPNIDAVVEAIESGDSEGLVAGWGNVLETSARSACGVLNEIAIILRECGLSHFLMSGSGPTMFVLEPTIDAVIELEKRIPESWFRCFAEMVG